MFVPVACSRCGKPFQVAEASVGQAVACPWCRASVPALPVAEPVAAQPEILSLDDTPPAAPQLLPRWPVTAAIVVAVMIGVAGLTLAVLRLGKFEGDWLTFTPPDEPCSVLMPTPKAERPDANPYSPVLSGGERFVAERRAQKATVTFGWSELDAGRAKLVRPEDLIDAEIRHRKDVRKATSATRPAPVRVNDFQGAEVRYETPNGTRVELLLVVESGPKPRLYALAVEGKGVRPDDPVVRRFFNSLRLGP
ncbi:MAG TPA: hypothetical protein VMZ71_04260 [Gemmataceae bacterium]|nr:hypothetical protein [Gemmataceae bacterium]